MWEIHCKAYCFGSPSWHWLTLIWISMFWHRFNLFSWLSFPCAPKRSNANYQNGAVSMFVFKDAVFNFDHHWEHRSCSCKVNRKWFPMESWLVCETEEWEVAGSNSACYTIGNYKQFKVKFMLQQWPVLPILCLYSVGCKRTPALVKA